MHFELSRFIEMFELSGVDCLFSPSNLTSFIISSSEYLCSLQFRFCEQEVQSLLWFASRSSMFILLDFITLGVCVFMFIPSLTGVVHEATSFGAFSISTTHNLHAPAGSKCLFLHSVGTIIPFLVIVSIIFSPSLASTSFPFIVIFIFFWGLVTTPSELCFNKHESFKLGETSMKTSVRACHDFKFSFFFIFCLLS